MEGETKNSDFKRLDCLLSRSFYDVYLYRRILCFSMSEYWVYLDSDEIKLVIEAPDDLFLLIYIAVPKSASTSFHSSFMRILPGLRSR